MNDLNLYLIKEFYEKGGRVLIGEKEIQWLIEQVEKVERYEKALKDVVDNYGKISPLGLLEITQKALED
jgi:uncharacterized phage-associated protein